MRNESLGLESDRYRENSRRKEDAGRVVDIVDSRDDASGGMTSIDAKLAD